jgi:hypothetical protein
LEPLSGPQIDSVASTALTVAPSVGDFPAFLSHHAAARAPQPEDASKNSVALPMVCLAAASVTRSFFALCFGAPGWDTATEDSDAVPPEYVLAQRWPPPDNDNTRWIADVHQHRFAIRPLLEIAQRICHVVTGGADCSNGITDRPSASLFSTLAGVCPWSATVLQSAATHLWPQAPAAPPHGAPLAAAPFLLTPHERHEGRVFASALRAVIRDWPSCVAAAGDAGAPQPLTQVVQTLFRQGSSGSGHGEDNMQPRVALSWKGLLSLASHADHVVEVGKALCAADTVTLPGSPLHVENERALRIALEAMHAAFRSAETPVVQVEVGWLDAAGGLRAAAQVLAAAVRKHMELARPATQATQPGHVVRRVAPGGGVRPPRRLPWSPIPRDAQPSSALSVPETACPAAAEASITVHGRRQPECNACNMCRVRTQNVALSSLPIRSLISTCALDAVGSTTSTLQVLIMAAAAVAKKTTKATAPKKTAAKTAKAAAKKSAGPKKAGKKTAAKKGGAKKAGAKKTGAKKVGAKKSTGAKKAGSKAKKATGSKKAAKKAGASKKAGAKKSTKKSTKK